MCSVRTCGNVLANGSSLAVLAFSPHAIVFAYQFSAALLAAVRRQMPNPKHSLHLLLTRVCSHMDAPQHSMRVLLVRLW